MERVPQSERKRLIFEAFERYPNHGKRTVAAYLFKTHPKWFTSEANAYRAVQTAGGVRGHESRKSVITTSHAGGGIPPLPVSKAKEWTPTHIAGRIVGILSDLHIPFHDETALETALAHLDGIKPDTILINGDAIDFYALSKWLTNPDERDFDEEINGFEEFLAHLNARFPKAKLVLKLGNHEERWFAYLWQKAPELNRRFGDFASLVHADKYGLEVIGDKRIVMLGKLPVLHGHELPRGLATPVNPARGAFLRTSDICLIGHLHRTSEHTEQTMLNRMISCWSTGCLCDLHPGYAPVNRWNHGFAWVEVEKDGNFKTHNERIYKGRIL